jgi:hypothetical protein
MWNPPGNPRYISEDCLYLNIWMPEYREPNVDCLSWWVHKNGLLFGPVLVDSNFRQSANTMEIVLVREFNQLLTKRGISWEFSVMSTGKVMISRFQIFKTDSERISDRGQWASPHGGTFSGTAIRGALMGANNGEKGRGYSCGHMRNPEWKFIRFNWCDIRSCDNWTDNNCYVNSYHTESRLGESYPFRTRY